MSETDNEMDDRCRGRYHGGSDGWWEDRSLFQKILMGIGFGILGIGLIFVFGYVVMLLWNSLMPEIFGLTRITYWQAWGLLLLSSILFKGMGSGNGGKSGDRKRRKHLRHYMKDDEKSQDQ